MQETLIICGQSGGGCGPAGPSLAPSSCAQSPRRRRWRGRTQPCPPCGGGPGHGHNGHNGQGGRSETNKRGLQEECCRKGENAERQRITGGARKSRSWWGRRERGGWQPAVAGARRTGCGCRVVSSGYSCALCGGGVGDGGPKSSPESAESRIASSSGLPRLHACSAGGIAVDQLSRGQEFSPASLR